jgi:hypothetical protein
MLQTSTVPECWRTSEIVSIPKSGDLKRPDNCRGIALIPVALKILCCIIVNRFNRIVEEKNLICPEQAGFGIGTEVRANHDSDANLKRRIKEKVIYLIKGLDNTFLNPF